jgi:hypothetical protein
MAFHPGFVPPPQKMAFHPGFVPPTRRWHVIPVLFHPPEDGMSSRLVPPPEDGISSQHVPPPHPPKGGLKNLNINALLGYKLNPKTDYYVLIWRFLKFDFRCIELSVMKSRVIERNMAVAPPSCLPCRP